MSRKGKALREIDKPVYNYWQALVLSFYSNRLYVDVGKRWRGLGLLYLLLLLVIITLPFSLRMTIDFREYFNTQLLDPLKKLPKLYIQNGQVSLDKPMPYMIRNENGAVVAIVDTTGKIKEMTNKFPALYVLITKDKIIYRLPTPKFYLSQASDDTASPVYVQPISDSANQVFDGSEWANSSGINRLLLLSELTVYPTIVLMFFVIYSAFFLVFAFMAQLIAKLFMKFSLTYRQACRLLTVSSTPQILLLLAALTFNFMFYGFGLLLLILFAAYFGFAVISLKRESHKLARQ
ncbi:DUF1189 family protein [Legionella spiritensis]|uniref:DUF1189 family protein n=1 Tax=Legionella spiritensis TaxID=452 RepID=UPI000F6C1DEB|nr:DUF1189 family protein [Legionella spiritensis]VEG90437.1 Protein of uncharacterised function (DUF1189) [Legionella spiritensis]